MRLRRPIAERLANHRRISSERSVFLTTGSKGVPQMEDLVFVLQAFAELTAGRRWGHAWWLIPLALGAALGALANWLHPGLFLPMLELQVLMLFVGPLSVGLATMYIAYQRRPLDHEADRGRHFAIGFVLALTFEIVRFAYGTH